jgi:CRISPR-associated exonuclease Cas4
MFSEEDLLPISALQHMLFCPRQCALIHVERLWTENSLTLEGRHLHQKADGGRGESRGGALRRGRAKGGQDVGSPPMGVMRVTRALPLRSLELGLSGKADVVEFYPSISDTPPSPQPTTDGDMSVPFPVEYKRGKPKKDGSDTVQLCAQALCLEEMLGVPVPAGALFYARLRRRVEVAFDDALRTLTRDTIQRMREMIDEHRTPPAVRDKRCDRCSLRFLCLPDATTGSRSAVAYLKRSVGQMLVAGPATD